MPHTDTAKNLRPWWLVILAVLIAVAAVFWAVTPMGDNDEEGAVVKGAADIVDVNSEITSPVQDYLSFAGTAGGGQIPASDADPTYIVEGLRKLAGALGTLRLGSPDLQVDLRVAAEHLLLNPASTVTTAVVRDDLIAAAEAIEAEHRNEVNLRFIAESIRQDRPLLDQQDAFREFFRESANAMQGLSPTS